MASFIGRLKNTSVFFSIYSVPVVVTPNPFQVAFKALLKKVKTRTLTIAQPGIEFSPHINGHWSPKQDK